MPSSAISYLWRDKDAPKGFRTGVSLHSHTNQSRETLDFLANFGNQFPVMRPLLSRLERRAEQMHGIHIDYAASYWTPPMTPKLAFDLEMRQIEKLGLAPMVSITDHDNIKAPMLLRTVPSARQIPVSVEWSAPYGGSQAFHLGVHNLPSARAAEWMATLEVPAIVPSLVTWPTKIVAVLVRLAAAIIVLVLPVICETVPAAEFKEPTVMVWMESTTARSKSPLAAVPALMVFINLCKKPTFCWRLRSSSN